MCKEKYNWIKLLQITEILEDPGPLSPAPEIKLKMFCNTGNTTVQKFPWKELFWKFFSYF